MSQREHSRAELQRKLLPHARAELAGIGDAVGVASGDDGTNGHPAETGDPTETGDPGEAAAARVERLLDELAAAGWLSDARAAESLVSTKAPRFGAARLRRMLVERGVAREAADAALEQARATEFQRAFEVWRRRFGEPATDAPGRARQQRFLLSRGFPAAIVRRITGGDTVFEDDPGDL